MKRKADLCLGDHVQIISSNMRGVIKEYVPHRGKIKAVVKLYGDNGIRHCEKKDLRRIE